MDGVTEFEAFVVALSTAGVRFVLIGGLAMRMHGSSHITDDIDICYYNDPANLQKLTKSLHPYNPSLRGAPPDLPFVFDVRSFRFTQNFTLHTDIGDIDLLGHVPGVDSFDGLWERSAAMQLFGCTVRVASLDDLIQMKESANRPKDRVHLMELRALKMLTDPDT